MRIRCLPYTLLPQTPSAGSATNRAALPALPRVAFKAASLAASLYASLYASLSAACAAALAAVLAAALACSVASATPMVYTGTVITDIKVGDHKFHNASVSVSFRGDTKDITAVVDGTGAAIPSTYCSASGGLGYFSYLTQGTARVTVTAKGKTLEAELAPGQIFVALDSCNGGIGFGAFIGPNGLEPAYPLAFTLGTAMVVAVNAGLSQPASMSGNAWSCIGYPPTGAGALSGTGFCTPPDAYPLQSSLGEVFVYQPYGLLNQADGSFYGNHVGAMNRGTFTINPARDD